MVFITEELVRKKSEHNELEIYSLEELSLHQENIERIEYIQDWCKELQILLLQGNLISKIENLYKLKKLQYLNLALNNIEVVENLEKLESLEKLDLTLNFINNIESIQSLKHNIHLKDLYFTGNPITDFTGYREYVITHLPQIQTLDNTDILHSERLRALQYISTIDQDILVDQQFCIQERFEQKQRLSQQQNDFENIPDDVFWKQKTEHCPEVRYEMAKRQRRAKGQNDDEQQIKVNEIKLFNKNGKPLNINQPKIKFTLEYDDINEITLDLFIYKYLDTNLLHVDIQPTYVTVYIKGKIFQLVLPEEIQTEKSTAQRSQITGNLVLKMPKLHKKMMKSRNVQSNVFSDRVPTEFDRKQRREFLEIGPANDRLTQLCNVEQFKNEFVDDPNVPALE